MLESAFTESPGVGVGQSPKAESSVEGCIGKAERGSAKIPTKGGCSILIER